MVERLEAEDPNFEILFTPEQIEERVAGLGKEITEKHSDDKETPVVLIAIMQGGLTFAADLSRHVHIPNLYMDTMGISSYGSDTKSSREPRITFDGRIPINEKKVIIVEDIIDTGYSMAKLISILSAREPKSLEICALLSKPSRREIDVPIDYLGFTIDDLWVQGYGLDTDEVGRHWPYIAYKK